MFCHHCGTHNPDNSRFCARCGGLLTPAAAPQPAPQPTYYSAPVHNTVQNPNASRVLDTVKRLGRSPLMLCIAICFTLLQLLQLVSVGSSSSLSSILYYMEAMDIPVGDLHDMMGYMTSGGYAMTLIGMIPNILVLAGLWTIYGSSFNRQNRMSTAGLTIIQVIQIIMLVFIGIVCGILLIGLCIALYSVLAYGASAAGLSAALVSFLLVGGLIAFIFVYYIKIITTISKIKTTIRTGVPNRKVSGFVAVILFIGAGFSLISLFTSIVTFMRYGLGMYYLLSVVSTLLSITLSVLVGVMIFVYKSKMRQLEYAVSGRPVYSAPVRPAAPVQPAAPVYHAAPVQPAKPVVEMKPLAAEKPPVSPLSASAPVPKDEPMAEPVAEVEVAVAEEPVPEVEITVVTEEAPAEENLE